MCRKRGYTLADALGKRILFAWIVGLWAYCPQVFAAAEKDLYADFGGANTPAQVDEIWRGLSRHYFGERTFIEGDGESLVTIEAPARVENDALVPITISTRNPIDPLLTISKIYLSVDVNPAPMAGVFTLSADRALEQISTRVRVNGYTYVRAIAELSDGTLHMDKQWVKSRGAGCSAPPGLNQAEHKKRLGNMRFRISERGLRDNQNASTGTAEVAASPVTNVQLMISHPNNTGMQRDQLSTLFIPQHYVKDVVVTFNDELLLQAQTTFSLSENPSFRFSFNQGETGELKAVATDTRDNRFVVREMMN